MAHATPLTGAFDAFGMAGAAPSVPTTRSVPSLNAALRAIRRLGGSVTSETRTAPGIGSWAFVEDETGNEVVLWEDAPPVAR